MRRAELLAAEAGCDLVLVHVIDEDQPQRLIDMETDAREQLLDEFRESIESRSGIAVKVAVRIGEQFDEIPRAAEEAGADLIVLGPHRRQVARSSFRGTTIERTMRRSPIPVLVANGPPSSSYKRALFTTKLDQTSARSIRDIQGSAFLGKAALLLLHVYDSMDKEMMSRAMIPGDERENRLAFDRLNAHEALSAFIEENGLLIDQALVHESCGSIATDILGIAADRDVDLIVVTPSSKSIFEIAILGRVSLAVLRQAERDVLVLPAG
jgi:nucleotide-binding universal stress UspA family protein